MYVENMQRLYDLGTRRVLVTGTGPMGCVPAELAMRSRTGDCDVELQRAAALFNPQLVEMLNALNEEVGSQVFIAANAYRMHMDFVSNPRAYGMINIASAPPCMQHYRHHLLTFKLNYMFLEKIACGNDIV